ncbi:hypothetical protein ESCOMM098M_01950 [Escherichia coli]
MVPVAQETTANTVRLPYSFSRRFSLVAWCEASLEILHVHPLSLSVLQELQRGLNAPFTLRQIDEAEFEQRLNAVWQRDSSEARQLMEDLGSAEDFFTLAEELPETEDLLESDDDAPIIKLINAMLAEAIKEGASDTLNDCQRIRGAMIISISARVKKGCLMFIPWGRMVRKTGKALAQISVTGICRSFSKQCLNADSHFWKSCW